MKLYCDNQIALHIASNPEIDCHFIMEKLLSEELYTGFITTSLQIFSISP